ncbi:MAG: cardiolipin synthase [Marinilabiliales bacterium]|nr:MAG: cardiolipin synthase [Marinilabiliales bacterium]
MSYLSSLSDSWSTFFFVLNVIYLTTAILVAISVILDNRNPTKTISWVVVLFVLPVLGLIFYFMVGKNYRKEKIFSRKGLKDFERIRNLSDNQIIELQEQDYIENEKVREKLPIINLLLRNSKALLTTRNRVEILNNGDQTFASIISELKKAKDHIHLEYYIIDDDGIGNEIRELLIAKSVEGVKVRIIYDDVGCWKLGKKFLGSLKNAGVELYPFMPVRFPFLANRINYRNHRKIIVIDGNIGFVGGINIADRYIVGSEDIPFWRDTHMKIEGEAVNSLQVVFLIDWYFVSGKIVSNRSYFPKSRIRNRQLVQITASGPDSDWASIMQAYFSAISTARHYIYITVPYFIPNESILTALKTAALSGIDVRIIIPGRSDSVLAYNGTMSYVEELLEAGIRVFAYQKGFVHSKLIMVDDVFASVGTANMDIRSFDDNFEINALVYDEGLCNELKESFLSDIGNCTEIELGIHARRGFRKRFVESFARIFSPLL